MRRVTLAMVLVATLTACAQAAPVADGGPCAIAVTALVDQLDGGPSGAPTPDPSFGLEDCTASDRQAAADLLSAEMLRRLQLMASEGTEPVGEDRALLNTLALLSAAMTPSPTFTPPPGWPATFPVYPDAQLLDSERRPDGTLHATWTIAANDPAAVIAFYETHLQQGLPGRWDFHSADLQQEGDPDGRVTYANTYQITGEDHRGTVAIDGPDAHGAITITAQLQPDP